ncbi:MAG TPA: hypothetical protein VIK91_24315 [Nannocystis sp.]
MLTSLATSSWRSRACGLAVAVALATPVRPAAAEPGGISEAAQSAFDRGQAERDAGRYGAAAREFATAYALIDEKQRELRAAVLFDLVDAHRNAFAAGGTRRGNEHPAAHLCAADRALADFIESEQEHRRGSKKTPDMVKAIELREEVRRDFLAARARESDLDCAALELPRVVDEPAQEGTSEPAPADEPAASPRNPKALVIAGSVTTVVGLGLLGLMAAGLVRGERAEQDGAALVKEMPLLMPEDPQLAAIERRGRGGNAMAILGGVFGSLALGAGVALLVVGKRAKARGAGSEAAVAVWPVASPLGGGAALRWRF